MPELYYLMAGAIRAQRQVLCTYHGAPREVCPVRLGQEEGVARALVWQFGGFTEDGQPIRGGWQWLALDEMSDVRLRDGPWYVDDDEGSRLQRRARRLADTTNESNYDLFARAIREGKQLLCIYHNAPREVCPVMLGHKQGAARALTWQFAGTNEKGESVRGGWKCLALDEVSDVELRDGPWHAGDRHTAPQTCIETVDLDVNPDSPYNPQREL